MLTTTTQEDDLHGIGFFKFARQMADVSKHRAKIGAVIVKKRPIGFGFNKIKTHPVFANPAKTYKVSIHAEVASIIDCKNITDLHGSSIYVYRKLADGTPANARPCEECIKVLKKYGIKKMYYTYNTFPFWRSERL